MNTICVGAGGHGRVVADVLESAGFGVLGFVDDAAGTHGRTSGRWRVLGGIELLKAWVDVRAIIGIGSNNTRLRIGNDLEQAGAQFATAQHPRSTVAAGVDLGAGTVVMAGAVINTGTRVGCHVIVNTGAIVDHDCDLGDGVHLSPACALAGGVVVERLAHVGIGAVVLPGLRIGAGATVGAGAVVTRDVLPGCVVMGVPARTRHYT